MRIVFAGTATFAGPTLTQLREAGHEVALVVTQPDRLGGRGMRTLQSGIKLQATEMHLPVFQPERIRTEAAQARIREVGADVMVVATEWPEFRSLDWTRLRDVMNGREIFDARGVVPTEAARLVGFRIHSLERRTVDGLVPDEVATSSAA